MTVLYIYSLDDTENQNVIACLPEGKHVIGRGELLQVTDKRVSRKHAVIEVSSDKVYLTSLHINPCFFKAANGKTLSVISQNQQNELNDGDQFALLPENYWFKVKIKKENLLNEPINGDLKNNIKRYHDSIEETDINSDSKRARFSTSPETSSHSSSATTSNVTLEANNIKNIETSHIHLENKEPDEQLQERNADELNTSQNISDIETRRVESNQVYTREIKEEHNENEIEHISPNISNSNNLDNASTSNPEIKEEPLNKSDNEGDILSKANNEDIQESLNNSNNENGIQLKRNDVLNDEQPTVKTESEDNDNQNKDGASGSGAGAKKLHRERCWYGVQCFRKNPNHRETFSHPGDQDYDSDPDDDRPDCPYGISCYRKNIEHRREYKHTGRPVPKPSNVNIVVNSGCPFCEHCNRRTGGGSGGGNRKPDYESDADNDFL